MDGIEIYEEAFGTVYTLDKGAQTRQDAINICQDESEYLSLPVPHSKEENDFFQELAKKFGRIWLGIRIVKHENSSRARNNETKY